MIDARRTVVHAEPLITPGLVRLDPTACRIVVVGAGGRSRSIDLRGDDTVTLGAGDECTLRVDDPTVSRVHAKMQRGEGGVVVTDLQSTNGTFFERARVRECVVPFGSTILLGRAAVKVLPQE